VRVCTWQLGRLNVTSKVNPGDELTERALGAAVAVALVAAVTGYRCQPKVKSLTSPLPSLGGYRLGLALSAGLAEGGLPVSLWMCVCQAGILGTITADGWLLTIATLDELDMTLLYLSGVSVVKDKGVDGRAPRRRLPFDPLDALLAVHVCSSTYSWCRGPMSRLSRLFLART
jgi:hypothetical protein